MAFPRCCILFHELDEGVQLQTNDLVQHVDDEGVHLQTNEVAQQLDDGVLHYTFGYITVHIKCGVFVEPDLLVLQYRDNALVILSQPCCPLP